MKGIPRYRVIRDVTQGECDWLPTDIEKGTVVYKFMGCDYGATTAYGTAIRIHPSGPFYELPNDSIELIEEKTDAN